MAKRKRKSSGQPDMFEMGAYYLLTWSGGLMILALPILLFAV